MANEMGHKAPQTLPAGSKPVLSVAPPPKHDPPHYDNPLRSRLERAEAIIAAWERAFPNYRCLEYMGARPEVQQVR
jgi:hypothetical protein